MMGPLSSPPPSVGMLLGTQEPPLLHADSVEGLFRSQGVPAGLIVRALQRPVPGMHVVAEKQSLSPEHVTLAHLDG